MAPIEDEKSWTYGRVPEYLWIGLILHKYGRSDGLKRLYHIIKRLHKLAPDLRLPRMSDILALDSRTQIQFFKYIVQVTDS